VTASILRLALVSLGCLVGVSAFASLSQRSSASRLDPGGVRPFIHLKHVPWVWADGTSPENRRDCRGCHVFDENGGRDPQAACMECHLATDDNQSTFRASFAEGWETLDGYRDPATTFRHHTHDALACRECHGVEGPLAPDPMPIRRGSAKCTRCHGPEAEANPPEFEVLEGGSRLVPEVVRRQLLDELNGSPNMQPDRLGPFLHSEHLADPEIAFDLQALAGQGSKKGICSSCHEPVVHSGLAGLQEARFKREACGECHIGRAGPLTFGSVFEPSVSLTAQTFSHADHLGFDPGSTNAALSSALGYARIEDEGCHACHQYDSKQRTFLVSGSATHEGCRSCHTSTEWGVEKHGEWEAWGCAACHTFERDGELAIDRPQASVRRRRSGRFTIASQVHPHIAGADPTETFADNCSQCHRSRVDALPSRLGTRAFSHGTHLPPNPDAQQCTPCHGARVDLATTSRALSESLDGVTIATTDPALASMLGATYDMRACQTCHRGGVEQASPVAFDEISSVQVTEFSHAQHIGKPGASGAALDCLTCHRAPEQAGGQMVTLPAASACTQCHDHRPGPNSESSGRASAQAIGRCSTCHVEPIPAAGGSFDVQRIRLASLVGSEGQFHPDDRDCVDCHLLQSTPLAEAAILDADHVFAVGGRDRTGRITSYHQHRRGSVKDGYLRELRDVDCTWCHWTQGIPNFDFESEQYRTEKKGNLMELERNGVTVTFPGGGYRAEFNGR
jgi:hypothetical protein